MNFRLSIGFVLLLVTQVALSQYVAEPKVSTIQDSLPQTVGGVSVDALGYVYVADFEETVWKVNPYSREAEVFAKGFYGASGNAFDKAGILYQANIRGNYISKVSRSGETDFFADSLLSSPVGIAINSKGELFVCNCGTRNIIKVSPKGRSEEFAKSSLLYCPNGLAFDSSGNLFVVSYHNNNVVKISPNGEVQLFAKTPDKIGNGHIAIVGETMYVTGFHGHRIYVIDKNGVVSVFAGTGERGQQDGIGSVARFSYPNGIAVSPDKKTLYINDMVTGEYSSAALVPSKSSLRAIKLIRVIDSIKEEMEENGAKKAMTYFNELGSIDELKKVISRLEINTLAYNYMMEGRQEEASSVFQMSLMLYPDWFLTYAFMGRNMFIADKPKESLNHYKKALKLNPDFESLIPIIKELEEQQ